MKENYNNNNNKRVIILILLSFILIAILISVCLYLAKQSYNKEIEQKQLVYSSMNFDVSVNESASFVSEDIHEILLLNSENLKIRLRNNSNGLSLSIKNNLEYNISVRAIKISENSIGEANINLIAGYCSSKDESNSKVYINNIKEDDSYAFNLYIRDTDTNSDIYKTGTIVLSYSNNSLTAYSTSELIPLSLNTLEEQTKDSSSSNSSSNSDSEEIIESDEDASSEIEIYKDVNTNTMEIQDETLLSINNSDELEETTETEEYTDELSTEDFITDVDGNFRKDTTSYEVIEPWVDEYKSKIGLPECGYLYINKDTTQLESNIWKTEDDVKIKFMIAYDTTPSTTIGILNESLISSGYSKEQIKVKEIYSEEIFESYNGDYTDEMHELILTKDSLVNIFFAFNYGYKPTDTIILEIAFPGNYTTKQIQDFTREIVRNYRLN